MLTPAIANGWEMYRTQMIIEGYASIFYGLIMLAGALLIFDIPEIVNGVMHVLNPDLIGALT